MYLSMNEAKMSSSTGLTCTVSGCLLWLRNSWETWTFYSQQLSDDQNEGNTSPNCYSQRRLHFELFHCHDAGIWGPLHLQGIIDQSMLYLFFILPLILKSSMGSTSIYLYEYPTHFQLRHLPLLNTLYASRVYLFPRGSSTKVRQPWKTSIVQSRRETFSLLSR